MVTILEASDCQPRDYKRPSLHAWADELKSCDGCGEHKGRARLVCQSVGLGRTTLIPVSCAVVRCGIHIVFSVISIRKFPKQHVHVSSSHRELCWPLSEANLKHGRSSFLASLCLSEHISARMAARPTPSN